MDVNGMGMEPDPGLAELTSRIRGGQRELEELRRRAEQGDGKDLEAVARRFEALFLNFLIQQMWDTLGDEGLFGDVPGRQVYDGLLVNTLADYLADHGGIGMAKTLTERLKEAEKAYRAAAGTAAPPAAEEAAPRPSGPEEAPGAAEGTH